MKNTNKLKFIIVLAVITGFIMTACNNGTDEGEGGGLTITGIPAEHNGRHAFFLCDWYSTGGLSLTGMISVNMQNETVTLPRISGGSVTIPIWTWDANDNVVRFTGNANGVRGWVAIAGNATVAFHDIDTGNVFYAVREWERMNFQGGNSNATWVSGN